MVGVGLIADAEDVGGGYCHLHIRTDERNHFIGASSLGGKIGAFIPAYFFSEGGAEFVLRIFPKSATTYRCYYILEKGAQRGSISGLKQVDYYPDVYNVANDSHEIVYDEVTGDGAGAKTGTLRPASNEKWIVVSLSEINVNDTANPVYRMNFYDGTDRSAIGSGTGSLTATTGTEFLENPVMITRDLYIICDWGTGATKIANTKTRRLSAIVIKLSDLQD